MSYTDEQFSSKDLKKLRKRIRKAIDRSLETGLQNRLKDSNPPVLFSNVDIITFDGDASAGFDFSSGAIKPFTEWSTPQLLRTAATVVKNPRAWWEMPELAAELRRRATQIEDDEQC